MNPIPGPMILLILPLAAAVVAYLVRRFALLAAAVSAATTGLLAILCVQLPLDRSAFVLGQGVAFGRPVVILGQTLVLDAAGQMWLAFVFTLVALLYLFAWRVSQGRSFFAFSLIIVALYALLVLLQSFALAVLVLTISATLAVFVLQAGQLTSIRGAQRYLLVSLLAVPLLLLAGWFVDQSLLYAADINGLAGGSPEMAAALGEAMARRALLPAALGFGFLLAAFPFGTWMPALAADAPPVVTAFIFAGGQAMALYLALSLFESAPALAESETTRTVIQLAGLVMAASGGLLAAVQRDLGRLFGYAALSDLGILLLAFSVGGSQSLDLVLLHAVNRSAALVLMAAALAVVRHRAGSDRFADLAGTARRLPVATAGLVLGGLALAGFPFTAGFPTHWAVSRATWNWVQPFSPFGAEAVAGTEMAAGQVWVWVLTVAALLASFVGIVIGLLRGLQAMRSIEERAEMERQPILASFMIVALGALTIVLGLYPQLFLNPVSEAVRAISVF